MPNLKYQIPNELQTAVLQTFSPSRDQCALGEMLSASDLSDEALAKLEAERVQ